MANLSLVIIKEFGRSPFSCCVDHWALWTTPVKLLLNGVRPLTVPGDKISEILTPPPQLWEQTLTVIWLYAIPANLYISAITPMGLYIYIGPWSHPLLAAFTWVYCMMLASDEGVWATAPLSFWCSGESWNQSWNRSANHQPYLFQLCSSFPPIPEQDWPKLGTAVTHFPVRPLR